MRGVAQVKREGGVDREIRVSLDPARLQALGVTAAEVNRQLRATNVDLAGGRGEIGAQEQSIRTLAGALDRRRARRGPASCCPAGGRRRSPSSATVRDGSAEPRIVARLDGEPVVAFGVYRAKGFSDVAVAEAVAEKLKELAGGAAGREDRPDRHDGEIHRVRLQLGDAHAARRRRARGLVVFLFLRDFRATMITAIAIPLSILPTFWAMQALGFSLNAVSLLAITLVTGVLVDDAIVEIENIVRHMRMGKSPYRAAIEAADEIGLAVVATTATIIAVFLPVSFMGGIAGQYFKQFGITVAIAVAFSLLVARLITPLARRLFPARPRRAAREATARHARLYVKLARLVRALALRDGAARASRSSPARSASGGLSAVRLHPRERHLALDPQDRAAARLDAGAVRRGGAARHRAAEGAARGRLGLRDRRHATCRPASRRRRPRSARASSSSISCRAPSGRSPRSSSTPTIRDELARDPGPPDLFRQ